MVKKVILSPHLDDAVFSCWQQIKYSKPLIINVFAGLPPTNTRKIWDIIGGEINSTNMMTKRRVENDQALANLHVDSIYLDFLDRQYRKQDISTDLILNQLKKQLPKNPIIIVPLAGSNLVRHQDHVLLRQIGILLANEGYDVQFFLDIPYMTTPRKLTNQYLERLSRDSSKLVGYKLIAQANKLTKEDIIDKKQAAKTYSSQYFITNLVSLNRLSQQLSRNYELMLAKTSD